MKTIQQGINVILKVDNKIVGGQQNVTLNRSSTSIDITNKIDADWKQSLAGIKTWSLTCSGILKAILFWRMLLWKTKI